MPPKLSLASLHAKSKLAVLFYNAQRCIHVLAVALNTLWAMTEGYSCDPN
jgi:hypothetical protein